jgi:hypothetical protein
MDPALLSTLHAHQQHFFSLPPEVQNSAMLMHQQSMALLNVQQTEATPGKEGDAGTVSTCPAYYLSASDRQPEEQAADGSGLPMPPSSTATSSHPGQLVQGPVPALQQQMHLMPFYSAAAMHPGFMVPPPGMAIPAPEQCSPHAKLQMPSSDAQAQAAASVPSPGVPARGAYSQQAEQALKVGAADASKSNSQLIPAAYEGASPETKQGLSSGVTSDPQKILLDVNCSTVCETDVAGAADGGS